MEYTRAAEQIKKDSDIRGWTEVDMHFWEMQDLHFSRHCRPAGE